jgi:poly-beta-1,6-N-acetyl-D-glucosamine synthase
MKNHISSFDMASGKELVLITAACNEGAYIERTIKSVLGQTLLPNKWIIISDGSVDDTDEIIKRHAARNNWIEYFRMDSEGRPRSFVSKVHALNEGHEKLKGLHYDFIGHIDADLSFDGRYFENILDQFMRNPNLGLAGGYVHEEHKGVFKSRKTNSPHSVAGGTQIYRRGCYESIGKFIPLETGGEDWYAEIMARMGGWEVRAFPEFIVYHHKPAGSSKELLRDGFRGGVMDFCMGSHPLFEIFKCLRRIQEKPYLLGAFLRLTGFTWSYLSGEPRRVSREAMEFLRKEQLRRIWRQGIF